MLVHVMPPARPVPAPGFSPGARAPSSGLCPGVTDVWWKRLRVHPRYCMIFAAMRMQPRSSMHEPAGGDNNARDACTGGWRQLAESCFDNKLGKTLGCGFQGRLQVSDRGM